MDQTAIAIRVPKCLKLIKHDFMRSGKCCGIGVLLHYGCGMTEDQIARATQKELLDQLTPLFGYRPTFNTILDMGEEFDHKTCEEGLEDILEELNIEAVHPE